MPVRGKDNEDCASLNGAGNDPPSKQQAGAKVADATSAVLVEGRIDHEAPTREHASIAVERDVAGSAGTDVVAVDLRRSRGGGPGTSSAGKCWGVRGALLRRNDERRPEHRRHGPCWLFHVDRRGSDQPRLLPIRCRLDSARECAGQSAYRLRK